MGTDVGGRQRDEGEASPLEEAGEALAEQGSGGTSALVTVFGARRGIRTTLDLFPLEGKTELFFGEPWYSSFILSGVLQACCVPWCFSMCFGEGVGSRTGMCGALGTLT